MNVPIKTFPVLAALCFLGLLASCAQPGAPLPPSLELPKPPSDLRAARKANVVTLSWSEPALTTDHESVRSLGPTEICRSSEAQMSTCANRVGSVPAPVEVVGKKAEKSQKKQTTLQYFHDELPPALLSDDPAKDLTYAVEVLNRNDRGAGTSNLVHVPAIQTLPAPADLTAELNDDGVNLTWTSSGAPPARPNLEFRYRIYRREDQTNQDQASEGGTNNNQTNMVRPGIASPSTVRSSTVGPGKANSGKGSANKGNPSKETVAGEIPVGPAGPAHFLDTIDWEKTYSYRITAVSILKRPESEVQIEGDDSPTVHIFAHDVFPPAVPAGLQAVYSGEGQKPYIDLIWAPVPNADLAGYNIFRSEGKGAAVKLNSEPVKTPSYRDTAITGGKTYTYAVSAVDVRGNESAKSEEASESVP